jgi:hypothetical protein
MKNIMILLFLFNINSSFSQDLFHSQCWKNTLKGMDNSTVIIAIVNRYDNSDDRHEGKKPAVVYYRDSLLIWSGKLILVDLQKMTWQDIAFDVNFNFQDYLNDSLGKIKSTFTELFQDPKREWGTMGHIELYYRDSSSEIINDYYSLSDGVNDLFIKQPHVFYLYSYAINKCFNIKFHTKIKYK